MTRKEMYQQYLKSDHWRELRAAALKKAYYQCEICCHHLPLHVHHLSYHNWHDVTTDDLIALCGSCHARVHALLADTQRLNGQTSAEKRRKIVQYGLRQRIRIKKAAFAERGRRLKTELREAIEVHGLNIRE